MKCGMTVKLEAGCSPQWKRTGRQSPACRGLWGGFLVNLWIFQPAFFFIFNACHRADSTRDAVWISHTTGNYWLSLYWSFFLKKESTEWYICLSTVVRLILCLCVISHRMNFALIESYKRVNVIMRCLFSALQLCEGDVSTFFLFFKRCLGNFWNIFLLFFFFHHFRVLVWRSRAGLERFQARLLQ